jgi:hypothetical protein
MDIELLEPSPTLHTINSLRILLDSLQSNKQAMDDLRNQLE